MMVVCWAKRDTDESYSSRVVGVGDAVWRRESLTEPTVCAIDSGGSVFWILEIP